MIFRFILFDCFYPRSEGKKDLLPQACECQSVRNKFSMHFSLLCLKSLHFFLVMRYCLV